MKKNNKKGFTLAELLVVVAIIGVLAAISIPVFGGTVTKAEHTANVANVRSIYAESVITAMNEDAYVDGDLTIDVSGWAAKIDTGCTVTPDDSGIKVETGKYQETLPVDDDVTFSSNNAIAGTK